MSVEQRVLRCLQRPLYRLRSPLVFPAANGDVWATRRLRVLDAMLDVIELPTLWRMARRHRDVQRKLDDLERQITEAVNMATEGK